MSTTTCIKCHEENAYYNGVNYECPNCDYEWEGSKETYIAFEEDEDAMYDDEEVKDFNVLLNTEKPFFKLKQGEFYNCTVGFLDHKFNYIQEPEIIIPLAFKENTNTFFVLFYNESVFKKYANCIEEISKMSYTQIENDSLETYFDEDFRSLVLLKMATTPHGKIIDLNTCLSDFKETETKSLIS